MTTEDFTRAPVASLVVGEPVFIVQRGEHVGPFTIQALTGGRTPDHIILRGRSGPFEHYADNWSLFRRTS